MSMYNVMRWRVKQYMIRYDREIEAYVYPSDLAMRYHETVSHHKYVKRLLKESK